MIYRYVDLGIQRGSTAGLSEWAPMGRMDFFANLANGEYLSEDLTYYIKGDYALKDMCGYNYLYGLPEASDKPEDNLPHAYVGIWKVLPYDVGDTRTIYLTSMEDEPWKFYINNETGNFDIYVKYTKNYFGDGIHLVLQNGMIQSKNGSVNIITENENSLVSLDSMHIQTGTNKAFLVPNSKMVEIDGSNIVTYYSSWSSRTNVYVKNSIYDADYLAPSSSTNPVRNLNVEQVVFSKPLSAYPGNVSVNIIDQIQENWTPPEWNEDISATNKDSMYYLSSAFNTITINGQSEFSLQTCPWSDTYPAKRDGVGFLYFLNTLQQSVFSQNASSGYAPFLGEIYWNEGLFTTASKVSINWEYSHSPTEYTEGTSASHIFLNDGHYYDYIKLTSKNGWYDLCVAPNNFQIYDSVYVSAALIVLDANFQQVTEGYAPAWYHISATNINGKIFSYTLSTPSGYFSDFNVNGITQISHPEYFDYNATSGTKVFEITLNAGYPSEFTTSTSLNILPQPPYIPETPEIPYTYYVDFNGTTSGTGLTENSPLNYSQFYDRVIIYGSAVLNDIYRIKGEIELNRNLTSARPCTVFNVDHRKNLTFDVWNASAYGPWIINVTDDYFTENNILNFSGVTLKNGIIYNKPSVYGNKTYGGEIKISNVYNMWIVNQGFGSDLKLVPISNNCRIIGSTIYESNKISVDNSINSSTYNVILRDSVFNKIDLSNQFSAATFEVLNNCIGGTSGSFTAIANKTLTDNQFNWEVDTNWPLLHNSIGFDEAVSWIIDNRYIFAPFDNIESPPNPGYGSSSYTLYEYGLFGFLRNLYGV